MGGNLEEKVRQGGFLPVQITLDGLQDILLEIIERLKDNQNEIKEIKNEKADKSEIQNIKDTVDKNKEETDEKIKELEKLINDKNNELLDRLNEIEKKADEALKTANDTKDKFGSLNAGPDPSEIQDLRNQLKELEEKINNVESNSREKDNDLESQIENLRSQFKSHENQNNNRFDELEQQIKDLQNSQNGDKYATKDDLSELRKLIDEIGNRPPPEPQVIERTIKEEYPVRPPPPRDDSSDLNAIKSQLEDHEKRITKLENDLHDINLDEIMQKLKQLQEAIDSRPDKDLIERLFEKFKESMNSLVDMINDKNAGNDNTKYATMKDLKKLEKMIKNMNIEFEEAAAARKSTKCLSCGKGYRTIAGVIPDAEQAAILGVAPISAVCDGCNKPCFVYGSDHELYYSSSPRGKTFVASTAKSTSDRRRDKKSSTQ